MKCFSARFDTFDKDDIKFLVAYLKLTKPDDVFDIVAKYYPHNNIPAKTKFLIEEIMDFMA